MTGVIVEKGHELERRSVKGRILVFPGGKGSSEGALKLYDMSIRGTSPAAIINIRTEPVVAVGAILGNIPTIDSLTKDAVKVIRDGDWITVNADKGTAKIGGRYHPTTRDRRHS